jgi:hypothetical protein
MSQQNAHRLKNINSFFQNKFPSKSIYLVVICNLTHLQDGDSQVKFMNITVLQENIYVESGSETI